MPLHCTSRKLFVLAFVANLAFVPVGHSAMEAPCVELNFIGIRIFAYLDSDASSCITIKKVLAQRWEMYVQEN